MSAKIYISYRRVSSGRDAQLLHRTLSHHFSRENIFMDVDDLNAGVGFAQELEQRISKCDVVLVLINRGWVDVVDDRGRRRIDNSDDWVRRELSYAFMHDVRVIPILVDGAMMPSRDQLPIELYPLVLRQAALLRHENFEGDVDEIVQAIKSATPKAWAARRWSWAASVSMLTALLIGILVGSKYSPSDSVNIQDLLYWLAILAGSVAGIFALTKIVRAIPRIVGSVRAAARTPDESSTDRVSSKNSTSDDTRKHKIFLCYRRDDSAYAAGSIFEKLQAKVGKETIFKDVDSIPLGVDFREHVRGCLATCEICLIIIGRNWLNAKSEDGERRLFSDGDHVRIEIETVLRRGIPVIPVLIDNSKMPGEKELPKSITDLAFRNGIQVRPDPDFNADIQRLAQVLT